MTLDIVVLHGTGDCNLVVSQIDPFDPNHMTYDDVIVTRHVGTLVTNGDPGTYTIDVTVELVLAMVAYKSNQLAFQIQCSSSKF